MRRVSIAKEFYHRLANRDSNQGDGEHNAVEFRQTFLSALCHESAWKNDDPFIELDFNNVKKIGPSFANEAFAYFTKFSTPSRILKKIQIINATVVQKEIINTELKSGYYEKD